MSQLELEATVLAVLWDGDSKLSARKVHECLERAQALAHTTVMTVLGKR
jgi:predicted transcriptional regulator